MFNLIYDEKILKYFFDKILYPLEKDEVFFVSLSGRKKYLTDEEREEFQLSKTEMFERRIIREYDWHRFTRTLYKYNVHDKGIVTKNGKTMPQKCLSIYMNINPASTLKALKDFNDQMNEYQYELSRCILRGSPTDNILYRIKKADRNLMTAYQRNRSRKIWTDIDFDIPHENINVVRFFVDQLEDHDVRYFIIKTHSGFHVLLDQTTIKYDITTSLQKTIMYSNKVMLPEDIGEIVVNKNEMIPVPGTLHADFPVHFVDKEGERL